MELQLAEIWSEVLGGAKVGRLDNFFSLGGNSLLAVQIVSRLRKLAGFPVPLRRVFEHPTIATLAAALERDQPATAASEKARAPARDREPDEGPVLSFAQERLWFLDQLEPNSPVYNTNIAYSLKGALDYDAVEHGLNEIVSRHEVLRTKVTGERGEAVARVTTGRKLWLKRIDLRGERLGVGDARVRELLMAEARRPFDLANDLLIRATLLRLREAEHVLLLTLHHIASDAWSRGILLRELAELYAARIKARRPVLPNLPVCYTDCARRQRESIEGEVLARELRYWRTQLEGAPPLLELPVAKPRPPRQSYRGRREVFLLDGALRERLASLAKAEGCTLFMGLLAVFNVLLHRYTGQPDILVGTPIANRDDEQIERLIGLFVNTLVLRVDVSGDLSFRELLARVRQVAIEAYSHRELPFEKLVSELSPERSLSHSPIIQVMLVFYGSPAGELEFPGIEAQELPIHNATAKFDLTMGLSDDGDQLSGYLEYNDDLFEQETIRRLIAHFRTLLAAAVSAPERKISRLNMLTGEERERLLVGWQQTRRDYPAACIHELFEAQARRTPDAMAAWCAGHRWSYRDLDRRANLVADAVREYGGGPGTLVAVCVERSLDMLAAVVGVLKSGGAYLPLDPSYPRRRLAYLLKDSGAPLVLTERSVEKRLPEHGARVLTMERIVAGEVPLAGKAPERKPAPGDLAYVIYTSGSTGAPKGVCVEHRNTVALLHWAREVFSADELSGVLASTSLCFDLSVFELFVPLSWGGAVILVQDVTQLTGLAGNGLVSLINTVPSVMAKLLEVNAVPPGVRVINLAGEPLSPALVREIHERTPVRRVLDLYGPTEDTTYSTWAQRTPGGPATIGRPIHNTRAYILDAHLQPVPVGVPGELCLAGAGVARGYLNRPELTAARFIPDPFVAAAGERLYRTGDLARFRPDGCIEFLGRRDRQVKLRGLRIELGEVEAALVEHPAVAQAVVLAREDEPGVKRLVAYVVAGAGAAPVERELSLFIRETLPAYMAPARIVFLDALPLTPNGKLDREALPAPASKRLERGEGRVTPRDPLEIDLAKIWKKTLGIRAVGVTDDFFELGGNSLLALSLVARLNEAFGRTLPLATLFEAPTIRRLAMILRRKGWKPSWAALVPMQPAGGKPALFCVHAARGNVLFYAGLARHLGTDQPVYGLQARGMDSSRAPDARVEDMAAAYIEEIKEVQPEGPYLLGGFYSGAYVALEMAHQLQQRGDRVELLVSFNTDGTWKTVETIAAGFGYHWRNLKKLGIRARASYVVSRLRYRVRRVGNTTLLLFSQACRTLGGTAPRSLIPLQIEEANRHAVEIYEPRAFDGTLVYFQGRDDSFRDPRPFWGRLVGDIVAEVVPGGGATIFEEPNARVLAERLRVHLESAIGR